MVKVLLLASPEWVNVVKDLLLVSRLGVRRRRNHAENSTPWVWWERYIPGIYASLGVSLGVPLLYTASLYTAGPHPR